MGPLESTRIRFPRIAWASPKSNRKRLDPSGHGALTSDNAIPSRGPPCRRDQFEDSPDRQCSELLTVKDGDHHPRHPEDCPSRKRSIQVSWVLRCTTDTPHNVTQTFIDVHDQTMMMRLHFLWACVPADTPNRTLSPRKRSCRHSGWAPLSRGSRSLLRLDAPGGRDERPLPPPVVVLQIDAQHLTPGQPVRGTPPS